MKLTLTSAVSITILLLVAVFPIQAQRVDATVQWLIVAPNVDAHSRKTLDSLVNVLTNRGKIPSLQINRIEGDKCSRDGIEAAIRNLASRTKQGERFILYFQGFVTIPPSSNTLYFLTYGATLESLTNALEIKQLNRWFRGFAPAAGGEIVILDGYTKDQNLEAFYANRELLASAAFVSIQPADAISKAAFAQNLLATLQNDVADLDDNQQLSIDELHRYIIMNPSSEGGTLLPTEGILVPTGNVEAIVLKLSPMLKVVTVPDGASVFLNGKESGVTPKRMTDNLERGTYNVEVRKRGYLIPPRSSIGVNGFQGEGLNLSWNLNPIAVYGSVMGPDRKTLEGARVWIEGTEYEQISGRDGAYRFADWKAHASLEPGKTYTLYHL